MLWQISVNIPKVVHDMTCQMEQTPVTLNDLEGHSPVVGLLNASSSDSCAAMYKISAGVHVAQFLQ